MNCKICKCELSAPFCFISEQDVICSPCLNKHLRPVCISYERVKSKKEKAIDILDGLIHILAPIAFVLLIVSFFWR